MVTEISINEYVMRAPALEDAEAVVEMLNAVSLFARGERTTSVADTLDDWGTPGFDLAADARVVETAGGEIVAYAECWDVAKPHVRRYAFVKVHPAHTGQGIGTALNQWVEQHALSRLHTAPDGAMVTLGASITGVDERASALLQELGFKQARSFWRMVRPLDGPLPAPEWPAHLRARAMRPGEERAFFRLMEDIFADHWGHVDQPFEEGFVRWEDHAIKGPHYDPELFFLVEDESNGRLAAMAWCLPNINEDPDMGWVQTFGVARDYRQQGVGLALLLHTFDVFQRRSMPRVGLSVDSESLTGATRLYEKAGMSIAIEHVFYEKVLRHGVDLSTQAV